MVDEIAAGHCSNGRTGPGPFRLPPPATLWTISPAQPSPLALLPIASCPVRLSPHSYPITEMRLFCCPFVSPFDDIVKILNGTHTRARAPTLRTHFPSFSYKPGDSADLDSQVPVSLHTYPGSVYIYVAHLRLQGIGVQPETGKIKARKVLARRSTTYYVRDWHLSCPHSCTIYTPRQQVSGVWSLTSGEAYQTLKLNCRVGEKLGSSEREVGTPQEVFLRRMQALQLSGMSLPRISLSCG